MDDTLIKQNSWEKLNVALGMTPEEDYEMYLAFKNRTITYEAWTEQIATIWRERGQATKDHISSTLHDFKLQDGAREVVDALRARGYEPALLTGSFDELATAVATELGISRSFGCATISYDEQGRFHELSTQGEEGAAKQAQLLAWCEELAILPAQCACVADGDNDLPMFLETGRGITFPDSPIQEQAWQVVPDLAGVLDVL